MKEKQNALPFGYVLTDNSLLYTDGDKEPQAVASRIEVVALTRDDKSSNWGRLIRFKDLDSITKEKVLPNTIFAASDGRELFELLLSEGLRIYNKGALKRYLMDCSPSKRALCTDKTGWYKGFYVLPDEIITPKSNQKEIVIYQGNKTTTLYCRQGTLEDWKENVASYAVGNSRLTFGISLALACPLLDIVGMESGGFHLVGPSSCGKSTILKVASSVWGGKEFIKTWRTTDNGLEGTAASRTDNLLVLDEIGQADAAKALEMVYMLGNEEGKARADKNGMTKKAPSWRLLFLSSGEKDLQDCAIESKKKVHAGQNIRLLNIPAIKEGSRYGAFEDIHNIKDGAEFSSYLNKAIRETYGTAGRAFLKNLINEDRERIKEDFNHFLDEALSLLPEEANSQARRAYNHFILAAYAGEKASKEGIVPWLEGTALEAALICFNDWCEERGGLDNQEEKEILGQVKHFFEQNAESRFEDLTGANLKTIVNMVGYKNIEEGHLVFYVFTESFKRDICKGLNFKLAKEVLKEKGWLENKNSTTKRIKNELRRVYTFLSKIYE